MKKLARGMSCNTISGIDTRITPDSTILTLRRHSSDPRLPRAARLASYFITVNVTTLLAPLRFCTDTWVEPGTAFAGTLNFNL